MAPWYRSDRRFRVRSRFKDPSVWRRKWKKLSRATSNWLDGHPVDNRDRYTLTLIPVVQASRTPSKKIKRKGKARKREIEEKTVGDVKKEERPPMRFIAIPQEPSTKKVIMAREAEYRDLEDEYSPQNISNHIQTAKYSLLTFIPKNLGEQFRRVANVYFLVLVLLQAIPALNNFNIGLASIPLVSILIITAIKDAIEDWRRHNSDNQVNFSKSHRLHRASHQDQLGKDGWHRPIWLKKLLGIEKPCTRCAQTTQPREGCWNETFWQDLRVGDILFISKDQAIPADIVLLSTNELDGQCYVETQNLDGETNLKLRTAPMRTRWIHTAEDASIFRAMIEVELPNSNLYSFSGKMLITKEMEAEEEDDDNDGSVINVDDLIPLSSNELLLRGCVIRNTEWIIGVIVYTGSDTKLMQNAGLTPSKRSRIERQMNPQIILSFVLLFLMCLICAIVQGKLVQGPIAKAPYWTAEFGAKSYTNGWFTGFLTFWSCLLLFQTIVPISLYITVEICKTVQAYLIYSDIAMYDTRLGQPCTPRSWNLSDDLGQIQYIFTDKTGTLTENIMEFRKCSINGIVYGNKYDQEDLQNEMLLRTLPHYVPPTQHSFVDPSLIENSNDSGIQLFFTMVCTCHTVLVNDNQGLIEYKAQSPDEAALVQAARDLGFIFLKRDGEWMHFSLQGLHRTYQLLQVIEFTSARRRMSVIVRDDKNVIWLFCKGADSVILERLASEESREITCEHLQSFAEEGLRTLCFAARIVSEQEYEDWSKGYREACSDVVDRELLTMALADDLEQRLNLIGATAIEDRLQEGVPETIEQLQAAGINIWVLTGDKLETAINIGFACRLLKRTFCLMTVHGGDVLSTGKQLELAREKMICDDVEFALIIDGESLEYALDRYRKLFVSVAIKCRAVICCRVTPLQKAQVVCLIRRTRNAMTLAIGDGANDVSMLQAADIGVGVAGQEGMQAVMSSDYAISQFRFLSRLLLVHGRWSYLRTAGVTLASFYKNIAFVGIQFCFQFHCAFTAQYSYDYVFVLFYNAVFSLLPVLALGFFDKDIGAEIAMKLPSLYQHPPWYSMGLFGLHSLEAVWQILVCFFVVYAAVKDTGAMRNSESLLSVGNLLAFSIIVSVNATILCMAHHWNIYTLGSILLSLFLLFGTVLIFMLATGASGTLWGSWTMFGSLRAYSVVIIAVVMCISPRIIYKYIQSQFFPTDLDIIREAQNGNVDVHLNKEGDIEKQDAEDLSIIFEQNPFLQEPTPGLQRQASLSRLRPSSFFEVHGARPTTPEELITKDKKALCIHKSNKKLFMLDLDTDLHSPVGGFAFSHAPGLKDRLLTSTRRQ